MELFDSNDEPVKMVIVTRDDISPGYQLVQSVHSLANFAIEHFDVFRDWQQGTNTLVCLSVADEPTLEKLYKKLQVYGVPITPFREPDVDNQLTSFCVIGTEFIRAKLKFLTPALKGSKNEAIKQLTGSRKAKTVS